MAIPTESVGLLAPTCGLEEKKDVEGMPTRSKRLQRLGDREDSLTSPYDNEDAKDWPFHSVCLDRYDNMTFISAPSLNALNDSLSDMTRVKKVIAIFEGKLHDFAEKRVVHLG